MANATVQAPTTEPEQNEFEWLDKADHWARGSAGIQLDSVKARMVLSRIKDLVAYIDKLKAAASS